jgi:hypothetical protein
VESSEIKDEEEYPARCFTRLNKFYDKAFLLCLGSIYANNGFQTLYSVCLNPIFKNHYGLSPTEMQLKRAFIVMPWDFKVLFGIIGDTIRIPFWFRNSPKRGYIVLSSLV